MKRKSILISCLAAGILLFSSCGYLYEPAVDALAEVAASANISSSAGSSSYVAPASAAQPAETSAVSSSAVSSFVSEEPEEPVFETVSSSAAAPEPAAPLVYAAAGDYMPQYTPTLTLYPDGTFHFVANLAEGMGNIYGTYSDNSGSYAMQVTERDFYGFVGDDLNSFAFDIVDSATLIYRGGSIGLTNDGETYYQ